MFQSTNQCYSLYFPTMNQNHGHCHSPCRGSGDFSSVDTVDFTDTAVAVAGATAGATAGAPRAALAARRALAGTQQRMLTLAWEVLLVFLHYFYG